MTCKWWQSSSKGVGVAMLNLEARWGYEAHDVVHERRGSQSDMSHLLPCEIRLGRRVLWHCGAYPGEGMHSQWLRVCVQAKEGLAAEQMATTYILPVRPVFNKVLLTVLCTYYHIRLMRVSIWPIRITVSWKYLAGSWRKLLKIVLIFW